MPCDIQILQFNIGHVMEHLILFFCILAYFFITQSVEGQGIGVNYGLLGNNLPHPYIVVGLLRSRNIQKARIFDPNPDVLKAFEGSKIQLILGTRNEELQQLASDPSYATTWVNTHIVPHYPAVEFRYISAGNEVIPGPLANFVLGAMKNLDAALKQANISVPVSTAVSYAVIGTSYPPSNGSFADPTIMSPIVAFLASHNSSLLSNVYPYFAYVSDPKDIRLDYALGNATDVVVTDGPYSYKNMFDAMVDAQYVAMEKVGGGNVSIVVTESGWPSAEGEAATIDNAKTYVNNLVQRVTSGSGTPRKPGKPVEAYIFAIFNENQKPVGIETNFGMYRPDMNEVYHVDFPRP